MEKYRGFRLFFHAAGVFFGKRERLAAEQTR
jgi:hypothetical protein